MSGVSAYEIYTTGTLGPGTNARIFKIDGTVLNGLAPSVFSLRFKPSSAGTANVNRGSSLTFFTSSK